MFCGLVEEELGKIRKKKRIKKRKKLNAAKSGLVEMKKYLKTYNHMIFAVFKPFLNKTAF